MISKKRFTIPFSQDCSNGWSMGRARLKFVAVLCCSTQSFCQEWWWSSQPSIGSWASPSIYLDDYVYQAIYKCVLSNVAVHLSCFFLVIANAIVTGYSWGIMLLYTITPSARFWLSEGIWGCLIGVWSVYCVGGRSEMALIHMCHLLSGETFSCYRNPLSEEFFT